MFERPSGLRNLEGLCASSHCGLSRRDVAISTKGMEFRG